jgi:dTDP-4-dehydrorhamnose reductase
VYATEGRNFLLTILRLATQRQELRIVRDQIGAPTLAGEIAAATAKILARTSETENPSSALADVSGIYHMTAGGVTSWYDFANAILEEAAAAGSSICPWIAAATNSQPLIATRVIPIPANEYPTPARRPAYSVLSNARLSSTFSVQLPQWRRQLQSVFANPPAKTP